MVDSFDICYIHSTCNLCTPCFIVFAVDLFNFDNAVDSDGLATFGGLKGRAQPKQDPPIERDLALALEEVFNGCIKKMKISRKV